MSGSLDLAPIAFDPKDTGIVYVGGYYGLFYKSTNAGTSWTSVSSSQSDINYIIVTNSGNLWTSGWAGVCLSTNGGSTWQNTGLPNINPQIVIASGDPNTLVASGNASNNNNNSLYRTTNGGSTWTNVTGNFGSNQCAIWCSSTDVLATSNKGFFLTTDGGSTWTVVDTTQYVCQQTSLVQAGGNLMGWGGFLFTVTGVTVIATPAVPVLLLPPANAMNLCVDTLKMKWHSVSGALGYVCQLSLTPSFSTLAFLKDSTTDTTFTVTSLQNFTKYYWRVCSYDIGGSSAFTATDSFTTIVPIPVAPTLVSPRSTATEARLTTFVWRPSAYAAKYNLQVATDTAFLAVVRDTTVTDTTATLKSPLDATKLYYWHVGAADTSGASSFSAMAHFTTGTTLIVNEPDAVPKEFVLLQNYPNPFNPTTVISYEVPVNSIVTMRVYDLIGRQVRTLINGPKNAGHYTVQFDGSNLASGVYFYRIEAKSQDGPVTFTSVKKLLFLK